MKTCRTTRLCAKQLKTDDDQGRQPVAPSCHGSQPHIANTNELTQVSLSFQIYLLLLARLLSKPSPNSERSASVAIPGFQYQLKPLITPWSGNQSSKRTPVGELSCSGLLQNAHRKTSSACSLSGNPNVLFPNLHSCHFHQLESS